MTAGILHTRRTVLKAVGAGLPLATVLADPLIARAVVRELEQVSIRTADGRQVSAALALPEETPAGAVLLIHEWWGLNDRSGEGRVGKGGVSTGRSGWAPAHEKKKEH